MCAIKCMLAILLYDDYFNCTVIIIQVCKFKIEPMPD